jgi:YceI-like domain
LIRPGLVIAVIAWAFALTSSGSAEERLIDLQRSTVTVRVFTSGLFRAFADDHLIQAPLVEGSIDDPAHVQLIVDARRMQVLDPRLSPKDRQQVQARMLGPDVLDVSRFEQIRFHSVGIRQVESGSWHVEGELELHGEIHPVTAKVNLDHGHYKGSASFMQTTFGIAPISLLGGTVRVRDDVRIDFDVITER